MKALLIITLFLTLFFICLYVKKNQSPSNYKVIIPRKEVSDGWQPSWTKLPKASQKCGTCGEVLTTSCCSQCQQPTNSISHCSDHNHSHANHQPHSLYLEYQNGLKISLVVFGLVIVMLIRFFKRFC